MNKYLLLFLVFPLSSFSEIIQGKDTVIYNHNIVFSPHSLSVNNSYNDTSIHGRGFLVYLCSAPVSPFDMFIAEEQVGTCTYICHKLAIGSLRPFYFSKNALFESINLPAPINLTDTSLFIKHDTVYADPHNRDSSHCYLPHIWVLNRGVGDDKAGNFGIFKNINGLNILAKFDTIVGIDTIRPYGTYPYLKAYVITWYLQTNGSLDFSGIVAIKDHKPSIVFHKNIRENIGMIFNIRGQKILRTNKPFNGVFILKTEAGSYVISNSVIY